MWWDRVKCPAVAAGGTLTPSKSQTPVHVRGHTHQGLWVWGQTSRTLLPDSQGCTQHTWKPHSRTLISVRGLQTSHHQHVSQLGSVESPGPHVCKANSVPLSPPHLSLKLVLLSSQAEFEFAVLLPQPHKGLGSYHSNQLRKESIQSDWNPYYCYPVQAECKPFVQNFANSYIFRK